MTEASSRSSSGRVRVYFEPGGEVNSIWDKAIFWILAAVLLLMPLFKGGPQDYDWAEAIFVFAAAAMGGCFFMKLLTNRDHEVRWSAAYIPIALFLLLTLLQSVPLPAGLVRIISPATLNLRSDLMHDLPDSSERLRFLPLTFYTGYSLKYSRLLLSVVTIFVVALNTIRRLEQMKKLLLVIAGIGAAIGLIALLQDLTGTKKILWIFEISDPTYVAHAGTFRNHSHFSQFMNLSIGAAIALALLNYKKTVRGTYSGVKEMLSAPEQQGMLAAIGVITICAAAVFLSLSRSGMLGLSVSGVVTIAMIGYKQHVRASRAMLVIAVMILVGGAVVLSVPKIRDAFSELGGETHSVSERVQILKGLPAEWKQYPLVGTGLGAFEFVFPLFDVTRQPRIATHAENEYAQLMTESGAIGVLMAAIFMGMVIWSYIRVLRKGSSDAAAIAIGMGYGLLAILVQSFFDYGQHLLANATLTALSCAIMLNLRQTYRRISDVREDEQRGPGNIPLRATGAVVFVVVFGWAIWSGVRASVAQLAWDNATAIERTLRTRDWEPDKAMYTHLLENAGRAVDFAPRNVLYRHWKNIYRWYAVTSEMPRSENGQLVEGPPLTHFTEEQIADLNDARWLCPTFAPNYSQLGQYESFQLERPIGADHIRTAYRLSPNDASIVFIAGVEAALDGETDRAAELLHRGIALDESVIPKALNLTVLQLKQPALALALVHGHLNATESLVIFLRDRNLFPETLATAQEEMRQGYVSAAGEPNPTQYTLKRAAEEEARVQHNAKAIELYRRVLALNYSDTGSRIALAKILEASGDLEQAKREAQICLRLVPHMPEAKALIERHANDHP